MALSVNRASHLIAHIVCGVLVAHYDLSDLAVDGLSSSIFEVCFIACMGFSQPITPLLAKIRPSLRGFYLKNALVSQLGFALVAIVAIFVLGYLLRFVTPLEAAAQRTLVFLGITAFSLLPFMVFQTFKQYFDALQKPVIPATIAVLGNSLHVVLSYGLIFGCFHLAPMGILGVAWASIISRSIMALAIGLYCYYCHRGVWVSFWRQRLAWNPIKKLVRMGSYGATQHISDVLAFNIIPILVSWISLEAVVVHQMVLYLSTFSFIIYIGLAEAAIILTSRKGSAPVSDKKQVTRALLRTTGCFAVLFSLLYACLHAYLPLLYTNDPGVVSMASTVLIVVAVMQIPDAFQLLFLGITRGHLDLKWPTFFSLLSYWGLALPIGYWMAFSLGFELLGIWMGIALGVTVLALLVGRRIMQQKGTGMKV